MDCSPADQVSRQELTQRRQPVGWDSGYSSSITSLAAVASPRPRHALPKHKLTSACAVSVPCVLANAGILKTILKHFWPHKSDIPKSLVELKRFKVSFDSSDRLIRFLRY
ncbi:hypothetical protein E2C01_030841 [Portunus trituberculatus]|uniref:Uncharacterized protein n=1 Tax=Portunus trituberculatus TaxID=210409 RepID=A0A5B7EVZ8_PORTR|nr:hypothetical protein [Portunus trituberculatus]